MTPALIGALLALTLGQLTSAQEVEPSPSSEQQHRIEALYQEFACVVCAGQSIAESNAEPAVRMRELVRDAVLNGRTDHEVRILVAERYGEAALLDPPADGAGVVLWLAPLVLMAAGVLLAYQVIRPKRLSPELAKK